MMLFQIHMICTARDKSMIINIFRVPCCFMLSRFLPNMLAFAYITSVTVVGSI